MGGNGKAILLESNIVNGEIIGFDNRLERENDRVSAKNSDCGRRVNYRDVVDPASGSKCAAKDNGRL